MLIKNDEDLPKFSKITCWEPGSQISSAINPNSLWI